MNFLFSNFWSCLFNEAELIDLLIGYACACTFVAFLERTQLSLCCMYCNNMRCCIWLFFIRATKWLIIPFCCWRLVCLFTFVSRTMCTRFHGACPSKRSFTNWLKCLASWFLFAFLRRISFYLTVDIVVCVP